MKLGLVYAGGVSKCAYQLGFTQTLVEYLPPGCVQTISATSLGILNGYALSAGKLDELEGLYRHLNITSKAALFKEVFFRHVLEKHIHRFMQPDDVLQIPLYFSVSMLPLFSVRYYRIAGEFVPYWRRYIAAATNFPFFKIFPSRLERRLAIDGGAIDNIPLYPLTDRNLYAQTAGLNDCRLDLILVLHFDARYDYRKEFSLNVPVLDLDVSFENGFSKRHYDFSRAYIDEMLQSGRRYADRICRALFGDSAEQSDLQARADKIFLSEHAQRQRMASADGYLSVLNRLGKSIRNDRSCVRPLDR